MTRIRQNALELDSAIDTILRGPSGTADVDEGELTTTARLLREALPSFHPRFSFEEHLAARLASARRMAEGPTSVPEPTPIRPHLATLDASAADVAHAAEASGELQADEAMGEHRHLGLVAGGAIASGVSIAGAALVVWRRSRSRGVF